MELKTIDQIRRECIRIGTSLDRNDVSGAREAIAKIQTRADATPPTDLGSITDLASMIELSFRWVFEADGRPKKRQDGTQVVEFLK